jgi:hypothetical protein
MTRAPLPKPSDFAGSAFKLREQKIDLVGALLLGVVAVILVIIRMST